MIRAAGPSRRWGGRGPGGRARRAGIGALYVTTITVTVTVTVHWPPARAQCHCQLTRDTVATVTAAAAGPGPGTRWTQLPILELQELRKFSERTRSRVAHARMRLGPGTVPGPGAVHGFRLSPTRNSESA